MHKRLKHNKTMKLDTIKKMEDGLVITTNRYQSYDYVISTDQVWFPFCIN